MERDGFLVDRDELNRLGEQYDAQIAELKNEIFSLCGVAPFNLNSPQQLGGVLFDTLGLPAKKKTARGYSTDADTLGELAELHPAVEKILLYRQVAKLKSTYIDGLLRLTGRDGRIQNASILFHICMAEFVKNSAALLSLRYHSLFQRGGRCERGVTFEKEDA